MSSRVRPGRSAHAGVAIGVLLAAALAGCGGGPAETSEAAPRPTASEAAVSPTAVAEPRIAAPEVAPFPAGTPAEQVFGHDSVVDAYETAVAFSTQHSFRESVLRSTDALTADDYALTGVSDELAADFRSSVEQAIASPDDDELWRNEVLTVTYSFEFDEGEWLESGPLVTDFSITAPQATDAGEGRIGISYHEAGTVHALSAGQPVHVDLTKATTFYLRPTPDGGWLVDGYEATWDTTGLLSDTTA